MDTHHAIYSHRPPNTHAPQALQNALLHRNSLTQIDECAQMRRKPLVPGASNLSGNVASALWVSDKVQSGVV